MSLSLLPQPQSLHPHPGTFRLPSRGAIGICCSELFPVAAEIQSFLPSYTINAPCPTEHDTVQLRFADGLKPEGYRIFVETAGIVIEAADTTGAFWAAQTLRQVVAQAKHDVLPCLVIHDWPDFQDRGVYYDVCRGRVPKLEQLLALAEHLSRYKINHLQLYIEHTFLFRGHPDIGQDASPLSAQDILTLDAFCRARHIELVPSIASFGHLATVLKHPQYHDLAEDWGVGRYVMPDVPPGWRLYGFTLSPANPKIYDFLDSLFAEFLPLFSSARFNACCDETWDLGWGQTYELCKERGKGRVYLDHIVKVNELSKKYGKKMMFWGDIIRHYPDLIPQIPKDVTVLDWGYGYNHPFDRIADFKKVGLEFIACPGTSAWVSLFPRLPEACANIAGFAAAAKAAGARGVLNTDWGDGGHYNFMEFSWHGYLFGAEQSWNTAADQPSFTARFCERFLGIRDAKLARALDAFGDITFYNVSGYYQSVWQTVLFATPDEAVFRQPQPVGGTYMKDGAIVAGTYRFDAALARRLLPKLATIRGVFAEFAGTADVDAFGVLPYWVFAADTIALAVRKLAAFGPGGKATPAERAAITRELRGLRSRFYKLWNARNRASEIRVTLARYDRAIRGESVRTLLEEVAPGRIRATVRNTGTCASSGGLCLTAAPAEAATFAAPAALAFRNLKPGAEQSAEFALTIKPGTGKITIESLCEGPGLSSASLILFGARDWKIPALPKRLAAAGKVQVALAASAPRPVMSEGAAVAQVRAAVAGDVLALQLDVSDATVVRGAPVWAGSCVEVFASASEAKQEAPNVPNPGIAQFFFAPPAGDEPAAAFVLEGGQIVPAPDIAVAATAKGETYTLRVLLPLRRLRVPSGARQFRLEVMVSTHVRAGAGVDLRRAPLFYATQSAWSDNTGYGVVTVE